MVKMALLVVLGLLAQEVQLAREVNLAQLEKKETKAQLVNKVKADKEAPMESLVIVVIQDQLDQQDLLDLLDQQDNLDSKDQLENGDHLERQVC